MHIVNGKAIYDTVICWNCGGTGKYVGNVLCPRWGQKMYGQSCPDCGSRSQHSHEAVGKETRTCDICEGKGAILENRCSSDIKNNWQTLPIRVSQVERSATFNEAYIGYGSLVSVSDYGRSAKLTDAEMISKAKGEYILPQYAHYVDENNNVARELILIRRSDGWSLVPRF